MELSRYGEKDVHGDAIDERLDTSLVQSVVILQLF
jgi:hypothetical protein